MRRWCLGLLVTAIGAASAVAASGADSVMTVRDGGWSELLYRPPAPSGTVTLRRTPESIGSARVARAGVDGVLFATWSESGAPWATVSKDGGSSWSPPRRMSQDIVLRAGRLRPGELVPEVPPQLVARPSSQLHIVQLCTPSLSELRERIAALGAEVLGYLPYNAHLVRGAPEVADRIRSLPFVCWVGPYEPGYRLEPGLLAELGEGGVAASRYVLQTVAPGAAEKQRLAADIEAVGGAVVLLTPNGSLLEAELTPAQALAVLHSDSLQWLQAWAPAEDDMDTVRIVSGANHVEAVGGYDGTGVVAEVMDSGIMLDHQDFDGIQVHGPAPPAGDHGTCTYGIVFGNGDRDEDGDPTATGMLPGAQGWFAASSVTDRYQHTAELLDPIGAVFQSNSWGHGRNLHYSAISAEMDDIIWMYDFPIFQSQSNSGDQYSRQQAWAKNIFSVGGVYHYDTVDEGDDCWCSGASIGPADDGRVKPDLTFFYDATWTTDREPGGYATGLYADFGGTSAATPMTAGTGGLILQMWADDIYGNEPTGSSVFEKRPHPSTLKAIMVNTAVQYPFAGTAHDHARVRQGWGLPSAGRVLDRAPLTAVVDESSVLSELEFDAYLAQVPMGQDELKVTLVYTDRAANPAAAVHRVNDVTLRVLSPDGTEYWGNHGLDIGRWSMAGGEPDTLNTVENVFLESPAAGAWRVEVHAVEVNMDVHTETPEDDQDYALVVYGVTSLDECRSPLPAPTGLVANPSADNEISLSWVGSAPEYQVWRSEGGCGFPGELVATVPDTNHVDSGVAGGIPHGYLVRGVDGCPSPDSECVEATASGGCGLEPVFAGLEAAFGTSDATCRIELAWSAATSRCLGPVVYNVYRSADPGFVPGPDSLFAACRTDLELVDADPIAAETISYVVRAEDLATPGGGPCGGLEDGNLERRTLPPTRVLDTGFETGLEGWVSLVPTPPITGEFVVDDPQGTVLGSTPVQPEDAAEGVQCLFTGRNPAGDIARADVDYGEVVAVSPLFDVSGFAVVELRLARWFSIRDLGEDSLDYFAIDVSDDGGASWSNLETLDQHASGHNQWTTVSFSLGEFVTLTDRMRIRVRASDGDGPGNVIEAAIDKVIVEGTNPCGPALVFADGFESGDTSAWSFTTP